jgi:uncharacterized protein involved in exopolysaccharide biosynthesis
VGPDGGEDSAMAPLLSLAATALRYRRYAVGIPFLLVLVTGIVTVATPRTYTASTSFLPQSNDGSLSRLAGLAAQFGVAGLPGQNPGQSPEFYQDLASAGAVLGPLVEARFDSVVPVDLQPATLSKLLRAKGDDSASRHEDAVKKLRKRLTVVIDPKTSVVTLGVETRWPTLSRTLAAAIVDGIINFDLHVRQSRASAEREFTEGRLANAKVELRQAEDALQAFLARNRQYDKSPGLQFEYDRLSRTVAARQQVYTDLDRAYEQARIDEVRNTPRVTVIEAAELPARPNSRGLVLRVLLAGIAGLFLGLGAALWAQGVDQSRAGQLPETGELRLLWRALLTDLRAPWRLFRNPESR